REDVPPLARHFLERQSEENRLDAPEMTADFVKMLQAHDWAGNVRELENYVARALVLSRGAPLTPELLVAPGRTAGRRGRAPTARGDILQDGGGGGVGRGIQAGGEGPRNGRPGGGVGREVSGQGRAGWDGGQVPGAPNLGITPNPLQKRVTTYTPPAT